MKGQNKTLNTTKLGELRVLIQNNSLLKASDYYRLWLRCRKQGIDLWVGAGTPPETDAREWCSAPPETLHLSKIGRQREAHFAHQKLGEKTFRRESGGDSSSKLEKNSHNHTETKIKRNFSQPPLPLNADNSSYRDFMEKNQEVKEKHTLCLGVTFSAKDPRDKCSQKCLCSSPSPHLSLSPLPSFSPPPTHFYLSLTHPQWS